MGASREEIQGLIRKGLTEDEIVYYLKNKQKFGATATPTGLSPQDAGGGLEGFGNFLKGAGKKAASTFSESLRDAGAIASGDPSAIASMAMRKAIPDAPTSSDAATSVGESVGEIVGSLPMQLGLAAATGGVVNPVENAIAGVIPKATTAWGAFGRAAVTKLPTQAAVATAITALDDPESLTTKKGLTHLAGLTLLGSLVDGAFGVKAFKAEAGSNAAKVVELQGLENIPEAPKLSQVITQSASDVAAARDSFENFVAKIDDFTSNLRKLSGQAGPDVEIIDGGFSIRGGPKVLPKTLGPRASVASIDALSPRSWDAKASGKTLVPSGTDVTGYSEEMLADIAQRNKAIQKMSSILEAAKRGSFSESRLAKLDELQAEIDDLSTRIAENANKLGQSAATQKGTKFSANKEPTTVIRYGNNVKDNFDNPIRPADPTRPGSGTQSPYAYVPAEQNSLPLNTVLTPKIEGVASQTSNLSEAEQHFAGKIDVGNKIAQANTKDKVYVLDSFGDRAKTAVLDNLHPLRKVDELAYDVGNKFSRSNARATVALTDQLYAPVIGSEAYEPIAPGLQRSLEAVGATADQAAYLQFYAQARQAIVDDTPFDEAMANKLIKEYEASRPEIVQAYNEKLLPYMQGVGEVIRRYELGSPAFHQAIKDKPYWASLGRSVYTPNGKSLFKGRINPESDKLVGDLYQNLVNSTRSVISAGENAKVLRHLVRAKMENPELVGVEILPATSAAHQAFDAETQAIIDQLPANTPESVKQGLIDMMNVSKTGRGTYPVWYEGKRINVRLAEDVDRAISDMHGKFEPSRYPENAGKIEAIVMNPLTTIKKTTQAVTGAYSVWRDLFTGGIPLDAAEIAANLPPNRKFNMFLDPLKAIKAYYDGDPFINALAAHGGFKGFHAADPSAELHIDGSDKLMELAAKSRMQLRISHPIQAFKEFAGTLSNAASMGYALRNKEAASLDQLATEYNKILGDPYKTSRLLDGLSQYVGFMNYPVQATSRQFENVSMNQGAKNLAFKAARVGGQLTPLAATAWWLTKDDPRFKALRADANGKNYIYIPNPFDKDAAWAIPKVQGPMGVAFQTLPEAMFDEWHDAGHTDATQRVLDAMWQKTMPNVIPLSAKTGIALYTGQNIDPITGQSFGVVPGSKTKLLAEDQASVATPASAKAVAAVTGIPAGKVDAIFRTFLIGSSYAAFTVIDQKVAGDNRPDKPGYTVPILGVKKIDARDSGKKAMTDFYSAVKDITPALLSLQAAGSAGNIGRVNEIVAQHSDTFGKAAKLQGYLASISSLQSAINQTEAREDMDSKTKYEQILRYKLMQREQARKGLVSVGIYQE